MESKTNTQEAPNPSPRFVKEKNEPLRFYVNIGNQEKRFNVLRNGEFTKMFRKQIRKQYKKKAFNLPKNLKSFKNFGINSAGNIVDKSKRHKTYLVRGTQTFGYFAQPQLSIFAESNLPTKLNRPNKVVPFSIKVSKKSKKNIQKELSKKADKIEEDYQEHGLDIGSSNFVKLLSTSKPVISEIFEPSLPVIYRAEFGLIPDSKHIDHEQKWNSGEGCCFYDYMKEAYGTKMENGKWNNKIPKELRLVSQDKKRLWEIMTGINDFDAEHIEGDWGVSSDMIFNLCNRFEMSCYLINEKEEFICYYQNNHPKKKKIPPIYALLANGHFNPIITDHKKKSLQHRAMGGKKKKKEMKEENKEVKDDLEIVKIELAGTMLEVLSQKIIETGKTPLPLGLRCDSMNFDGFMLDGKKYIYDTEDNQVGEMFANYKKEKWRGTGIKGYAMKMFEEKKYLESHLTPSLYKLFTNRQVKDRAHRGFILGQFDIEDELLAIDINKAYTYCVLYPLDEWYIMGFDSVWLDPPEKLEDGFYYVETEDRLLFHRSNIYSKCIVELGLKENIITNENIKKFLPPIRKQDKNRFVELFDEYMNLCPDNKKVGKFCCNLMTGLLGRKSKKKMKTRLSTNFEDVAKYYADFEKSQIFCKSTPLENNQELFIFGSINEIPSINNHLPSYIQVLDNMNVHQYNMMKTFMKPEAFGKMPIYRKVDMFCCEAKYFKRNWKSKLSKKIGGYKHEIVKKFYHSDYSWRHFELSINQSRRCSKPEKFFGYEINDSNQFDDIEKWVMGYYEEKGSSKITFEPEKQVLMIEGDGGTGKTHIIKKFDEKYRCLKMAFTNKACVNINGTTYHRGLALNKRLQISPNKFNTIERDYDIIVCEEFSMNTAWIWNYILWLRKMTTLPIVLCGDWGQCRPVENHKRRFDKYQYHPAVSKLVGASKIKLTKNHRCADDKPFAEYLSKHKKDMNGVDVYDFEYHDHLNIFITKHLCYFNKTRKRINREVAEEVIKRQKIPECNIYKLEPHKPKKGKKTEDNAQFAHAWDDGVQYEDNPPKGTDKNPQQTIRIFTGTPMIARMTEEKGEKLFNNEDFKIISITEENVKLQSQNRDLEYQIPLAELQSKFLVAWCLTTHKAQGQTIKETIMIHNWLEMNNEIKYTAMSRATNAKNVFINFQPTEEY